MNTLSFSRIPLRGPLTVELVGPALRSLTTVIVSMSIFVFFCGCIPPIRQQARIVAFPVMNEKIYLNPIVDSSSLELFEGWPSEKPLQNLLRGQLRKLDGALLAHFRQREKYGLYEMVEDSLLSSIRITFVLGRFESTTDEITFPVRMTVRRLTDTASRNFSARAVGRYRAKSRPKSEIHYLNILLADFRRHFPYELFSGVFYRPFKDRERRQ